MEKTLRELVDELPTQSLELYVQAYEAGEVGDYHGIGQRAPRELYGDRCRCPRAALGFPIVSIAPGEGLSDYGTPYAIEEMALYGRLDPAGLYSECALAIAERDAGRTPEPAPNPA